MSYTTHMFPYSTHNMACYNIPRVSSLLSCNCARLTQGQNNNAPSLVIGILGHCYKAPKTAISHGLTPLPYSTPKMHLATSLLFKTGAALANLMQNMFELRGGTQKNSHNCSGLFLHHFEKLRQHRQQVADKLILWASVPPSTNPLPICLWRWCYRSLAASSSKLTGSISYLCISHLCYICFLISPSCWQITPYCWHIIEFLRYIGQKCYVACYIPYMDSVI